MTECVGAFRKKRGADSFHDKISNIRIYVCEFHFQDEDLTTTLGRGKKKVTSRRVLSIFREPPVKHKAPILPLLHLLSPKLGQMKFYHHHRHH